jgi:ParB family chromosome partitioning protein
MADVHAIQPNPHQPRASMDEAALQELADSIKEHGLIQPLVVQAAGAERYTLIAGERRWRASMLAGLERVPVVVKEASPQEMLELALIENIQRADLNPLEEAHAYQQLIEEFGLTQAKVAQRVGKSRPAVANTVRLLNLPPAVQQAVSDQRMTGGHARTLLSLADEQEQAMAMDHIIERNLSVRQAETMVQTALLGLPDNVRRALLKGEISNEHAQVLQPLPEGQAQAVLHSITRNELSVPQTERLVNKMLAGVKPRVTHKPGKGPELLAIETQFRESLGFRVDINQGAKGGQIVIYYYSEEDLQTIYEAIVERGE